MKEFLWHVVDPALCTMVGGVSTCRVKIKKFQMLRLLDCFTDSDQSDHNLQISISVFTMELSSLRLDVHSKGEISIRFVLHRMS